MIYIKRSRVAQTTALAAMVILLIGTQFANAQEQPVADSQELGPPTVSEEITLEDAVGIALENNPRIQAQRAEEKAARARVGMARAMTMPHLATTTFATTGTMPNIIPGSPGVEPQSMTRVPDKTQLNANLMAMYPLYTGGRLRSQVKGAQSLLGAATSDVWSSELDVALDAKVAFQRVLLARRFVDAYRTRVVESRERVRIAEEAFREGRIARYDLLRNQTELAEAEQALVNAERDVDVAVIDLKSVLGVLQSSSLTISGDLAMQPTEANLDDLQTLAFMARPEVAAVRLRVESTQAGVDVAKSAYKPQIYAVGMQDVASTGGDSFDQGFTLGVTASLPIFDGGRRRSEVDEAQSMVERMRAEERDVVLAVNRDVATAWAELQAAARNVDLSQVAVEQAEEDYRIIKLRYEAGRAINVEVLDALASLIRAQTNYAMALYEHNVAGDRLERAVGGDLLGPTQSETSRTQP